MSVSHRSYDRESIAILTNVEIGQQDIEIVSFHLGERFSNIGSDSYVKSRVAARGRAEWARIPSSSSTNRSRLLWQCKV